jgi:hypothetical protein
MNMNDAATIANPFNTILFHTLSQLVAFIIRESFIKGMVARDGGYIHTSEVNNLERQLQGTLRSIVASGVTLGSFEFFAALNAAAGCEAEHCEHADDDLFSGRRQRYTEVWDAIAYWSWDQAEALRSAAPAYQIAA